MSDLSLPPLSLVPLGSPGAEPSPPTGVTPRPAFDTAAPVRTAAAAPIPWPAPLSIGYAAPPFLGESEPCELEGPNGKVNVGRLLTFDADAGQVQILIPPARHALTLRFTQFRRLSLTRPLEPTSDAAQTYEATTPLLPQNLLQPYRLRFKDGSETTVSSVGVIDRPLGLFTFTLLDASGRLLRSLYPRPMLVSVQPVSMSADDLQDTAPMGLD